MDIFLIHFRGMEMGLRKRTVCALLENVPDFVNDPSAISVGIVNLRLAGMRRFLVFVVRSVR